MKWIALLKVFDKVLVHEWHSGSCTYYNAQTGFDTKEEAEAWVKDRIEVYYKNNTDKYAFTPCILNYDESQSSNIEAFFKHM